MARVRVRMFATVREAAGVSGCEVEAADVSELLRVLGDRFGAGFRAIASRVGEEDGLVMLINGNNIHQLNGMSTRFRDGDEVAIFPPVSGG